MTAKFARLGGDAKNGNVIKKVDGNGNEKTRFTQRRKGARNGKDRNRQDAKQTAKAEINREGREEREERKRCDGNEKKER